MFLCYNHKTWNVWVKCTRCGHRKGKGKDCENCIKQNHPLKSHGTIRKGNSASWIRNQGLGTDSWLSSFNRTKKLAKKKK